MPKSLGCLFLSLWLSLGSTNVLFSDRNGASPCRWPKSLAFVHKASLFFLLKLLFKMTMISLLLEACFFLFLENQDRHVCYYNYPRFCFIKCPGQCLEKNHTQESFCFQYVYKHIDADLVDEETETQRVILNFY